MIFRGIITVFRWIRIFQHFFGERGKGREWRSMRSISYGAVADVNRQSIPVINWFSYNINFGNCDTCQMRLVQFCYWLPWEQILKITGFGYEIYSRNEFKRMRSLGKFWLLVEDEPGCIIFTLHALGTLIFLAFFIVVSCP